MLNADSRGVPRILYFRVHNPFSSAGPGKQSTDLVDSLEQFSQGGFISRTPFREAPLTCYATKIKRISEKQSDSYKSTTIFLSLTHLRTGGVAGK